MNTLENANIEDRLRKIESHLLSIDRTYKRNRKVIKGVLIATGAIAFCIIIAWIIWMITNGY